MAGLAAHLKNFDAYPRTMEDFRVKTMSGAVMTAVSSIIITILFISEFRFYLKTELHTELFVDVSRQQKIRINFDVLFPKLGCAYLSVDAMDVSGEQQSDLEHSIFKKRIDCFGAAVASEAEKHVIETSLAPSNKTSGEVSGTLRNFSRFEHAFLQSM